MGAWLLRRGGAVGAGRADRADPFAGIAAYFRDAAASARRSCTGTGRRETGPRGHSPYPADISSRPAHTSALCTMARGVLHGDLGQSVRIQRPVADLIA